MSEVTPEARAIIEAASGGDAPSQTDRQRVLRAVLIRVGAGVAAGTMAASVGTGAAAAGASHSSAGAMSTLWTTTAGKAITVVSLIAVVTGGVLGVRAWSSRSVTQFAAAVSPPTAGSPAVIAEAAAAASSQQLARSAPTEPSAAPIRVEELPVANPAPSCRAGQPGCRSSLDEEVAALRRAHEALRDGNPQQAMAMLRDASVSADDSLLAEERTALRVLALCRVGRSPQARAEAERFLARWPHSPQAPHLRAACLEPPGATSAPRSGQ
jgi:hypothetical protein